MHKKRKLIGSKIKHVEIEFETGSCIGVFAKSTIDFHIASIKGELCGPRKIKKKLSADKKNLIKVIEALRPLIRA